MPWHRDIPWHRDKRYPIRTLYPKRITLGADATGTQFCDCDILWERLNADQKIALEQTEVLIHSWYQLQYGVPNAPDNGLWEKLPEDRISIAKRNVPLGCLGTFEEYAKAVLFLADDGYMVGQVLTSNGGIHI